MTFSKHRGLSTHPESDLGETTLECYACGERNPLVLGFIPAKADSVVMVLCRQPCANQTVGKDPEWCGWGVGGSAGIRLIPWPRFNRDLTQWQPLVVERTILPWLVQEPSRDARMRARQITSTQIRTLEDLWRVSWGGGVRITRGQLQLRNSSGQPQSHAGRRGASRKRPHGAAGVDLSGVHGKSWLTSSPASQVQLIYEDAYELQNIFSPLVMMEADYDRRMKESLVC